MYLAGRFGAKASVIKFSKQSFKMIWKLEIKWDDDTYYNTAQSNMNEILSVSRPEKSDSIYCAGYAYRDYSAPVERYATVFKMDSNGEIAFLYRWGQMTPSTNANG